MTTGYFDSFDEKKIFYRSWNYNKLQKTLIVIHRGHEHSERLDNFALSEECADYNVFSYDLRGHGYTEAKTSPKVMDYVRDLEFFVRYLQKEYNISKEDIFLVANSIGGVIAITWINYYTPNIAGVALLAPAFQIKLYMPLAKEFITLMCKIHKNTKIPSYVKSKVLTHDPDEQRKYNEDKLITKNINGKFLLDVLEYGERAIKSGFLINLPVIIFSAGKDYVVNNKGQKLFYLNLLSPIKEFVFLENSYHGIMFEENKKEIYTKLKEFISKSFLVGEERINIQENKESQREYESILLRIISLKKKVIFGIQKVLLNKLGWLGGGFSIGLHHGFDSGPSLDYIYKNKASGKFFIGKILDRFYLNQTGWKGIRERKINLLSFLRGRINSSPDKNVKILDIAGGVGNYLFDIKNEFPNLEIVINEFNQENIRIGEEFIKKNKLQNIKFTNYDCFNVDSYEKMNFHPDIVIISGIFELFNDNTFLDNAIKGISNILSKDGAIIYTGQPYHPQLHQIAFVLNSHRKSQWIMRLRCQQELDNIFIYNGYVKKDFLVDNNGIFTVSVVEREK